MTATIDPDGGEYPDHLYSFDHPLEVHPTPGGFSAADVARYRERGFLGVADLLTPDAVGAVLAGLAAVLDDPRGADVQYENWAADRLPQLSGARRMDVVRRLMGFTDRDPRLRAVASSPRLLQMVRALAGTAEVVLFQDMALLKPPGGGREKPWHQDNAFFALEPSTPIVGVWIALDAATPENGCLHLRPGSHRLGPGPHVRRRDWQLCDTDAPGTDVVVPLPPGGALFFDGLVHHGSPANRTTTRRRALQLHYVPAAAAPITEERRLSIFGAGGADAAC